MLSRISYTGWSRHVLARRVEGRLVRVEWRLNRVEGRLNRVEGRLSRVEGRLSRVEGRLRSFFVQPPIIKLATAVFAEIGEKKS